MVGKGSQCVGLTTLPPSCANCLEIWESQPPGTLRACPDLYRDCFTFTFTTVWCGLYITWGVCLSSQCCMTFQPGTDCM